MRRSLTLLAASAVLCASLSAEAALVHWGARAVTSVGDCPSFCTNVDFGPTLGGEGFVSSGVSAIADGRGEARASAELTGGFNAPVLKAGSSAESGAKGAFATALGVQGYTYTGPGETLTLDIGLDGLVTDPEADATDTRAELEVVLYAPQPFGFTSDRGTLDFEFLATPLVQPGGAEASVLLQLDHTNPMTASGRIDIEVESGDAFYIWAYLLAEAQSGSEATSAEAFKTATMSFLGSPQLVAASTTVVPLPGALWLLGPALLVVGVAGRRGDRKPLTPGKGS